jgi:hypothetical protein
MPNKKLTNREIRHLVEVVYGYALGRRNMADDVSIILAGAVSISTYQPAFVVG